MMLVKLLLLVLAFSALANVMIHASDTAFSPVDKYLISCGSPQNISFEGMIFVPDSHQTSFKLKSEGDSVVASSNSTVPPIYQSLRIFTKPSSYEFSIGRQGRHWIRLYFNPLPNSAHDLNSAPITTITDKFVLLNKFTFSKQKSLFLFKEYMINVTSNKLTISFIPSKNSVSFVNGIEVVSVPDDLIPDHPLEVSAFPHLNSLSEHALETAFRLNVGGPWITPQNDTLGRTWENDQQYLHFKNSIENMSVEPGTITYIGGVTTEAAPQFIYATADVAAIANGRFKFNITWVFPVDPTFAYFVRLHFCNILSRELYRLQFNVYINSDIAITALDLSALTRGWVERVPYYKDFISSSSAGSNRLSISIGPDKLGDTSSAINGIEIMKISNDEGSLDGKFSVDGLLLTLHLKKSKMMIVIGMLVWALATMGVIVVCYFYFSVHRSKSKAGIKPHMHQSSLACLNLGRVFTFQEMKVSTNEFSESLLLGVGGFGKVYKGILEDGTHVAVKRGDPRSKQGLAEFQNELDMLSKVRHRHLVSLIGYCIDQFEMILVYEFIANGTLRSHLYEKDLPSLSWKQRLEICLGAARGLHYLHTGAAQSIIHRDVKTANILLDENFVAKVADFGISKIIPDWDQSHVSTTVKGSFGYLDPEYFRSQRLTKKSDVYSFGVVLMEVLCGKPALNYELPTEVNLAEWVLNWQKKGMLVNAIDPVLVGKTNPTSLAMFGELAEKCLEEQGVNRPTMGDVEWNLGYILQLEKQRD